MKDFGGDWTENKLDTFIAYVTAYLTILNKYKSKYGWKTVYFDGFAGAGTHIIQASQEKNLFSFDYSDEELSETTLYKGAVARVLELPEPFRFDRYIFVDKDKSSVESLRQLVNSQPMLSGIAIDIELSDCNQALQRFVQSLTSRDAALIFLDPFGMQVNWESISDLRHHQRSDIWLLIPSGVAVNRLIKRDGSLLYPDKLERFFGLSEEQMTSIFYQEKDEQQLSLFDLADDIAITDTEPKIKIPNATEKIADIYIQQLKTIWKFVTESPLILYNNSGRAIFHLVFASNNEHGRKIAQQIITKRQKHG